DQKYRGIVIMPPKGDVYLLVWVDNHDEAMDWARNKTFEVNRYTGTFQIYEPLDGAAAPAPAEAAPAQRLHPVSGVELVSVADDVIPEGFLLAGHKDEDLWLLGVPEPLLPAVRALRTELDLDRLAAYLPAEAS